MNPEHQGNGPEASSNVLVKRKRGRPRKDRSQNTIEIANALRTKVASHSRGEQAHANPGSEPYGTHSRQVDSVNHNYDAMVGQPVTGVIEASFDAGFLLSVKVGGSETCLRGVVFKPGHYVPVSADNDVAPQIQMIRRNVMPIPDGHNTQVHVTGRRGRGRGRGKRERHMAHSLNGSTPSNQFVAYRENQEPLVAAPPAPPLVDASGTVASAGPQPASVSNGEPPVIDAEPIASQPAHLVESILKQTSHSTTNPVEAAEGFTPDGGSVSMSMKEHGEASAVDSEDKKESENPSPDSFTPEQTLDVSQPLAVQPCQLIQSDHPSHCSSISPNFGDGRTGKMTELLMAVQENLKEKQVGDAGNPSETKRDEN